MYQIARCSVLYTEYGLIFCIFNLHTHVITVRKENNLPHKIGGKKYSIIYSSRILLYIVCYLNKNARISAL